MELLSDNRCPAAAQAVTVLSCAVPARRFLLPFQQSSETPHATCVRVVQLLQRASRICFVLLLPSHHKPQSCELVQRHSHQPIGKSQR
jgi:hypothetical protein